MSEHLPKPITYDKKKLDEELKRIEAEKNKKRNYYTIKKDKDNDAYRPTFK